MLFKVGARAPVILCASLVLAALAGCKNEGAATNLEPAEASVATGSATLRWEAPAVRTDGTPLEDLAGYRIRYGTSSGNYSEAVHVNSAGATSQVVSGLKAATTYYFAVFAVDGKGVESPASSEVSKVMAR